MRKSLGWVAIAVGLVVAVVLVLLSITSDTAPERVETPADTSLVGVPQSADGAERYLAELSLTWPVGVPQSADAAERYLAELSLTWPVGVPQSADAAERYLAEPK
ncbi:hypothetical protein [Nocardioides taihuensis]|uniref:DUF3352 domain-containing protein n=1 Tax=Nocardioides taihuensis TaxID=1835606 RepID=A0ABW0BFM6_9ACTN